MQLIRSQRGAFPVVLGLIGLAMLAPSLHAQTLSPYSDFQAMSQADLATLQIKLTYVGPTDEPLASVLFTSSTNTPDIDVFVPFRRSNVEYANDDDVPFMTFTASTAELEAVIDQVGMLPEVTAGVVTEPARVSFSLYNSVGMERVFESVTDQAQATDLFEKLRLALGQNAAAMQVLDQMACATQTLEPGMPNEVTSDVGVTLSGFRLDHAVDRFVTRARVVNNSGSPIAGPVSLVLRYAGSGFRLSNRTGTTCAISPTGTDYVNLVLPGGSLQPGLPVDVKLEFDDPDRLAIRFSVAVFAGAGAR